MDVDGKTKIIGLYAHEVDAAEAHDDMARIVRKRCSRKPKLNFKIFMCFCDEYLKMTLSWVGMRCNAQRLLST